jgi:hypothetical protein
MKYMLLIYEDEQIWRDRPAEAIQSMMDAYFAYTAELRKAGVYVAGEALRPVHTATTVRVRDGKRTTTDGPFAETKEQLGGFYWIDVPDLDQAIAWAARVPTSATGSIEVRPLMEFDEPPAPSE